MHAHTHRQAIAWFLTMMACKKKSLINNLKKVEKSGHWFYRSYMQQSQSSMFSTPFCQGLQLNLLPGKTAPCKCKNTNVIVVFMQSYEWQNMCLCKARSLMLRRRSGLIYFLVMQNGRSLFALRHFYNSQRICQIDLKSKQRVTVVKPFERVTN